MLRINDKLTLGDKFKGTIRYIGEVGSKEGKWIGLELNDPVGANDGSVNGTRYFDCKEKHGIFVRYEKIKSGLICESEEVRDPWDELSHQRDLYESKIKELEETIEALKKAENNEIVELRRENESVKEAILGLQRKQSEQCGNVSGERQTSEMNAMRSEVRNLLNDGKDRIREAIGLILEMDKHTKRKESGARYVVDADERSKVLFFVIQVIYGALDEDVERIEYFKREFEHIMKKYDISVE